MSLAFTPDDIDDIENNLLEAEANLQSYVDSSVQTFRTNAIYRSSPWMSDNPETVMQMAAMDIDTNTLLNNNAVAWGMMRASTLAEDLRNKLPSTQRAIYSSLSPSQQDSLQKMGYTVPKGNDTTKSWYDGPLGTVSAPFRWSVSDVLLPRGADLLKTFIWAQDNVYNRPIRTISDLSTPSKVAAVGVGAAAAYVGFVGASAFGLGPLYATGIAITAAVGAGSAAAFLSETIQGNPSRFIDAWTRAGDGEKFFSKQAINKATELLGDEGITTLAKTFAQELGNQTDLYALLAEISGSRDALLPEKQFDQIKKIAATISEPESESYFKTIAALQTIVQEPLFQEAIVTLQQGKVSIGRLAAQGINLNPGSSAYNFISGMVDGAYMFTADPLLLLGSAVKATKSMRYGMEYADGAVMANKFQEMYSNHKSVQRVFDVVAKGVVNGDVRLIKRYTPQWFPLYDQLRTYYNAVKIMPDFDKFGGQEVVNFITDGQRFSSIMQGIGISQGATRQTLKTLGSGNYLMRSGGGMLGDFLRGAGDANIYHVIEKISKNPNFQNDLISYIPKDMRDDFLQLLNNQEMSTAYEAGLKLAQTPVVGAVLRPIGAIKEGLVTPALTKQAVTLIDRPEAVKDITDLVHSFNQIGLSSFMQDIWIKAIIDNPSFKGRVEAIAAMIDSLATAGNLRQTREGTEVLDNLLSHFKQHYAFGSAGSMSTKTGYYKMDKVGALPIRDANSIMIGLPDMKLLRKATADGTWFRTILNIPEGQYISAFQNKIWKPAVLLKYGFALRNSGEDILAMIARAGSGYFMQELAGRSIGNYDAYQEAKKVLDEFTALSANVRKGARLTERQKWLIAKNYDVPTHIRPLVRMISRLGTGKNPALVLGKNYGKWLATFLRGTNRQESKLVDLMKYFRGAEATGTTAATGAQAAASREFLENLSLSPNIIKDNFRSIGDLLVYGNEYSWRRMLVGGVDKRKVIAGQKWASENIIPIMDRLGTAAGLPLDLDIPTLANQRELGGVKQVRLTNGERGIVRHGEQNRLLEDFHVSVHERTSEMSDDPLVAQVKQALLKVYSPDIQEVIPPYAYKEIINSWKQYLGTGPDNLGGLADPLVHLWFVINEPLEHPERLRRYQAALNLSGDGIFQTELMNNFGGLRIPTPNEFMDILLKQDPNNIALSSLDELTSLVSDIQEPYKTWVMANMFQDWATDGQHWGPEVMQWNGVSVGRSKGQPIYRMMQRPGEQYVINPDGSITLFFQEQGHWGTESEALSFSLSHEQTLRYAQGVGSQPGIKTRPVVFTTTVDDTFAAHGITKENIGWRDYSALYENRLPYTLEGKGATFVQAPEGPYVLESPDFRELGRIGHRELALHAEKSPKYREVRPVIEKRDRWLVQKDNILKNIKFNKEKIEAGTLDAFDMEGHFAASLENAEKQIEDLTERIRTLAPELDPINTVLPTEMNSITYPAGTYTLHVPDGSIYDDIDQTVLDELTFDLIKKTESQVDQIFSTNMKDKLNEYFAKYGFKYSTNSVDNLIMDLKVSLDPWDDQMLTFVFPNIDLKVADAVDKTVVMPNVFQELVYKNEARLSYMDDAAYPPVPGTLTANGNVMVITVTPDQFMTALLNEATNNIKLRMREDLFEFFPNTFKPLLNDFTKLKSLQRTKGYHNNINDPLGPESSRIGHLLNDSDLEYYTYQRDELLSRGDTLNEVDQFSLNIALEQLNQHNLIQSGALKPGEIFADYSTSPFYSSFEEIEPAIDMELARIIESGEFDDVLRLNRRVVETGPTQEVFVLDTSNLPPYIAKSTRGELPELGSYGYGDDSMTISRTPQIGDTWDPVSVETAEVDMENIVLAAIDTRTPLVFSTRESAEFYLRTMNDLLEKMSPYKPKGNVARNLEQRHFVPEVKSMYLPVKDPDEIMELNKIFGFATENSEIPVARKMFSVKSKSEINGSRNTPEEAFDVIGWPTDNYPVVSEYLYDAATQGSQKQIIEAARETIKQRTKAGRRIDYTATRDGQLWILNEGRPRELKAGDVLPSSKVFSDPRMGEEDLVNLGDMRFMDQSEIRYGGDADINWHTIGPLLYDDAEKLSGRKLYEGTQSTSVDGREVYLDNIPIPRFSVHDVQNSPAGNLPNLEIASVYEDIPSGSLGLDKVIQFGFGKVLGPIMDAMSRKPIAFHAFSIALERNLKNIDWMLYETKEELALNALSELFQSKSILGPQSPELLNRWADLGRQVGLSHGVPEAEFWSAGEAISYIRSFRAGEFDTAMVVLKNSSTDSKVNALLNFGKKNKGNVIFGDRSIGGSWDFLDYMTSQLGEDIIRTGGADWAIAKQQRILAKETGGSAQLEKILDELQPEDFVTLQAAWNSREKAFEQATFYAQEATIRDTMPFIDTHEIRSQFADHGRGFMPFFYAEENFMKRWARIAAMDSGMNGLVALRKFQLQYTGLREMGVIRKSETGDDYFVMPGTDLFIEGLANITGLDLGLTGMLTQPVNKMLPGIGPKFGAPSYSPLVIMPVSFISGLFPEFEPLQDLERNIIGEDNGLDRSWYSHFLPTTMVNTIKAIKLASASQEELRQDEKLSSNLNVAMAHLMAEGKGPKPNATAAEQENFLRDATNYARVVEITRLLGGWVSMAPAGTEINIGGDSSISWLTGGSITNPSDLLRSEYYDMIREMGIDDGTVAYLATYINSGKRFGIEDIFNPLAYTVSNTTSVSGAVIPTTKDALQFYLDNKKTFSEYKLGGAWMLPGDSESNNDFSQWAWNQSIVEGLRRRNTPQEVLNELMFREGATVYFAKKDEYETNALNAQASGDTYMSNIWKDKWQRFSMGWKASHPIFNDILSNNDRAIQRKNIIDEIQIIVKDPEFPKTNHTEAMKTLMQGWNAYMNTVGELSLNQTAAGRSRVAEERVMWQMYAENFIKNVPQLKTFWLSVLKPESGLD